MVKLQFVLFRLAQLMKRKTFILFSLCFVSEKKCYKKLLVGVGSMVGVNNVSMQDK